MIFEIAELLIKPNQEAQFIGAAEKAIPYFKAAKGCRSFQITQGIENPSEFKLTVAWDSVEDHMVTFRESDGFQQWRSLVSDYFASPPNVYHVETVINGF